MFFRGGSEDSPEDKAFRRWFRHIGELRSFFPNATVMALSATCTQKILHRVMRVLNFNTKTTTVISVSPNRSNIKLNVMRVATSVEESMYWFVDALETHKQNFPKTIVYCNSIQDVSRIYSFLVNEVPQLKTHIEMFHSETVDDLKRTIINEVGKSDSIKRVIIATSAMGMGIDLVDFNSVILYGPPRNSIDFLQEIGRVGRNNLPSIAVVMYNSYHVRKLEPEMKKFCTLNECRRKSVLQHFLTPEALTTLVEKECGRHTCCDICDKVCSCGHCQHLTLETLIQNICDDADCDLDVSSSSSGHSDADETESTFFE